jgi:hypothetical protein
MLFGQDLKALRIEVSTDIDAEAFNVETIDDKGVLIFYASNEVNDDGKRKWYFALFNTSMEQEWMKFIPLSDNIEFLVSRRIGDRSYFLFKNTGREKGGYGYYEIVTYDSKKEKFDKITGAIPEKASYAGFDVINNTACLALNLNKFATDLVFIDLNNGSLNPVHIDVDTPGFIHDVFADPKRGRFYIVMKQNTDRRYVSEQFLCYGRNGNQIFKKRIENTEPLNYFDDYTFIVDKQGGVNIFGTYNTVPGRNLSLKDLVDDSEAESIGMFFLSFTNDKQNNLKYYDFMKFGNIPRAIGPGSFVATKNQLDSMSNNNKVYASFSLASPHVYQNNKGDYIFSVEVYNPYYRTETRMDYDFYGRPYPYTYRVFSGYDFKDVIVASMNSEGDMLWNNDFPIYDILTFSLSKKSVVFSDDEMVSLAYINDGKVISQTIKGSQDIDRNEVKIASEYSQDQVTDESNSHIVKWYGDYFLIYGYQTIKNRSLGKQSTRTVFYANKIAYK